MCFSQPKINTTTAAPNAPAADPGVTELGIGQTASPVKSRGATGRQALRIGINASSQTGANNQA